MALPSVSDFGKANVTIVVNYHVAKDYVAYK